MNDIKILIASHEECVSPKEKIFLPIQVGKKVTKLDLKLQSDDLGENISEKNQNYCELTAYYWAWKNLETDVIGLYHYRRYFNFHSDSIISKSIQVINEKELNNYIPCASKINKCLKNYDIILAKSHVYPFSMYVYYTSNHIREDLDVVSEVLQKLYPEYQKTWEDFLHRNNKFSPYNMLICRKELFDDYCDWLFDILFEVEKKVKISEYKYQSRVFGFIAERLLNVFCRYNNLKIKYKPVLLGLQGETRGGSFFVRNGNGFLSFLSNILTDIGFIVGNHKQLFKRKVR